MSAILDITAVLKPRARVTRSGKKEVGQQPGQLALRQL